MRVVDPARAALAERHEGEPLAVARHQVQAVLDAVEQLVVGGGGPSNSITDATCMCAEESSMWRNEASSALRRSPITASLLGSGARDSTVPRADPACRGSVMRITQTSTLDT